MKTIFRAFTCLFCTFSWSLVLASEGIAGPDQTICGTAAVLSADPLTLGESGFWAVVTGAANFTNEHDPLSQVTGLAPGENVLQWTLIGDGPVEVDQMTITVYDPVATSAYAGPDSVLCLPVNEMQLSAVAATPPAIGSWSSIGIALIDVFTDPHSSVTLPAPGSAQLIWTVFNGTCGQAADTAMITSMECVIGMPEGATNVGPILSFDATSRSLWVANARAEDLVEVMDACGRSVLRSRLIPGSRVVLPELGPGAYVARSWNGWHGSVLRFVIHH